MRPVVLKKFELINAAGDVVESWDADISVTVAEAAHRAIRRGHRDGTIRETSWEGPRDVARLTLTERGGPTYEQI